MVYVDLIRMNAVDPDRYRRLYAAASAERRARADRYRRHEDAVRCILGEALVRRALSVCGKDPSSEIFVGEHGKPYVEADGFGFSISHAGEFVALAYAEGEVGVDVERVETEKPRERIAERFFTARERTWLAAEESRGMHRAHAFTALWTMKESYVKYLGTGLGKGLATFTVDDGRVYEGESAIPVGDVFLTTRQLDGAEAAYYLSVASGEQDVTVREITVLELES